MSTTLILYVHGALSTKNSWNYIRNSFVIRHEQLNAVHSFVIRHEQLNAVHPKPKPHEEFIKYSLTKETSADIVTGMVDKIKSLITKKKIKKVVFIGHSFGGVLSVQAARELTAFFSKMKVEAKIISLSSPFAGNEIPPVIRMMRPNSIFFKNVGDHAEFIRNFKRESLPCETHSFVTVEGKADWMIQDNDGVVTVESQKFFEKDPKSKIQEIKANHFEILLSDLVVTQLLKET